LAYFPEKKKKKKEKEKEIRHQVQAVADAGWSLKEVRPASVFISLIC